MAAGARPEGKARVVLLGAPGSGKGTQAEILARELGVPAVSTGDVLRRAVETGSDLGERVRGILACGALVDDATMEEVVRGRLAEDDARQGFILDGYPRTVEQARALDGILRDLGMDGLDAVVLIEVPEGELVERALLRRRDDDQDEVVRRRLTVYRQKTEPLVDHYRRSGLLRVVDGFRAVPAVAQGILAAVTVEA